MPGPAAIMREIHRLRRHAAELQTRIDQGPKQRKNQQGTIAHFEEAYRQAQDAIKHLKVTTHEKEVSLKSTLQQIEKYEGQLNQATSKKEYDALKAEIAAARQKVQRLEDEVLEAMAQTEERSARLPEAEKAVQQAKAELVQFEREAEARQADFAEQHRQTLQTLAEVEATLPQNEVRALYERAIQGRGADALAAVQGRTCLACYTEITAEQSNQLTREQFVHCKSCGRILYLAE